MRLRRAVLLDLRRCVKQVNHACAKRPESGRFVTFSDHLTCSGRDGDYSSPLTLRHIYVRNLRYFFRISVPLCNAF